MDKLQEILNPVLELFSGRPYIQSGIVVVLTLILSRAIVWTLLGLLRQAASRTQSTLDDVVFTVLRTPLSYTVLMLGLSLAVRLLPLSEKLTGNLIALLQSIGIFVWMMFLVRISKAILRNQASDNKTPKFLQSATIPLFENMALILTIAIGIYLIFETWNIDMTAWLASAGIVGIAVGFAAKDTLANLFSGVFILADMPYKIGDYVVLDSKERGEITRIGIRSTRMLTRDDVELTIPNSIMGNSKIVNESGGPHQKYRIRIPVGVAYGSDVDQVRELLMNVAENNEMACKAPEPRVRFRAFGNSSLDFELLCWIEEPSLRGRAIDILLTDVYKQFTSSNIEIPFSKQDLYIKEMPRN
jgi:small-conductance mechanosensitive channel